MQFPGIFTLNDVSARFPNPETHLKSNDRQYTKDKSSIAITVVLGVGFWFTVTLIDYSRYILENELTTYIYTYIHTSLYLYFSFIQGSLGAVV